MPPLPACAVQPSCSTAPTQRGQSAHAAPLSSTPAAHLPPDRTAKVPLPSDPGLQWLPPPCQICSDISVHCLAAALVASEAATREHGVARDKLNHWRAPYSPGERCGGPVRAGPSNPSSTQMRHSWSAYGSQAHSGSPPTQPLVMARRAWSAMLLGLPATAPQSKKQASCRELLYSPQFAAWDHSATTLSVRSSCQEHIRTLFVVACHYGLSFL